MAAPLSLSVMWSEDGGAAQPGRLDVGDSLLTLAGGSRAKALAVEVPFAELRGVRIGRGLRERLGGRATLLLELRDGRVLSIAGVASVGVVHELADRLLAAVAS